MPFMDYLGSFIWRNVRFLGFWYAVCPFQIPPSLDSFSLSFCVHCWPLVEVNNAGPLLIGQWRAVM